MATERKDVWASGDAYEPYVGQVEPIGWPSIRNVARCAAKQRMA
jgi:hypothetical protein